ncbi:MAG: 2'-5' RNA ligase family protein [Bryobacteraceae bacterium]
MSGCSGTGSRINSFALVSYLPEPLAGFLDRLRRDLGCERRARAHLTVLPPRPLSGPIEEAWPQIEHRLSDFQPFRVELGGIEIFPVSRVIYVSVLAGYPELNRLHSALNNGLFAFDEPFVYHPHVTLAQELGPAAVSGAAKTALQRWRDFPHARDFTVDRLTLVQNTLDNRWIDLRGCALSDTVRI